MAYAVHEESGDLAVVVVDRKAPGVDVSPLDTMGLRGAGLESFKLNAVSVKPSQIVQYSRGLEHIQSF